MVWCVVCVFWCVYLRVGSEVRVCGLCVLPMCVVGVYVMCVREVCVVWCVWCLCIYVWCGVVCVCVGLMCVCGFCLECLGLSVCELCVCRVGV